MRLHIRSDVRVGSCLSGGLDSSSIVSLMARKHPTDAKPIQTVSACYTEEEVDEVLGKDSALFKQVYDVRPQGNWEGRNILHRLRTPMPLPAVQEGKLNALREKLFVRRSDRVKPARDDKVLADWNGLMIYGLLQAADALNRVDWQAAAVRKTTRIWRARRWRFTRPRGTSLISKKRCSG